ncbi:carbohydrate sulfotransferase 11-like isoform X2 [Tachypleus tridentatus]|uniref:carbohydrate sulfotransferase 11-like isoform X2 n=1 Tax=Tachypleus tridentatus TaxID=6853 RepID=UPI003FD333D0
MNQILYLKQELKKPENAFNDSILEALENRYKERLRRAEKVCNQQEPALKHRLWSIASNEVDGKPRTCSTRKCTILVDRTNLIYYCFIPKVASTAIKTYFLEITNKTTSHSVHDNNTAFHIEANDAITRISPLFYSRQTRQHFYKIIFVRHPFSRLVSAYENKVLGPRDKLSFFYDNYWNKVMKKYRGVEEISNRDAHPTFEEFVRYLLDTPVYKYDNHWVPYTKRCEPCLVHYDFIGKLETAEQDFHYVFQHELSLTETPQLENRGSITTDKVKFYFRQVPKSEVLRLYYIYKMDFDIFGYDINDFVK